MLSKLLLTLHKPTIQSSWIKTKRAADKLPTVNDIHHKYRQFRIAKQIKMIADRVTRDRLRQMKPHETLTVKCRDYYDQASQKNTAYAMSKLEGCRFCCHTDGLMLTVIRL